MFLGVERNKGLFTYGRESLGGTHYMSQDI